MKNLFSLLLTLAVVACSAQHKSLDKQVAEEASTIHSVMVFGISDDRPTRVNFEERFSTTLSEGGVATQPTYVYLPSLESLEDEQAVIDMYQETGADYGLTVEVIDSNEAAKVARGALFSTWVAGVILDSRELRQVGAIGGLGAHAAAGSYQMRLILWDADTAQAMWSVDTQSFSNEDLERDATSLAEFVLREWEDDGLLN